MKSIAAASLLVSMAMATVSVAQTPSAAPAPDNTKSNSLTANSAMQASTADGQSNMASDLKITQQIRRSVIADKTLSTYAHNVKIVSVDGAVTLNGVVMSKHEKRVVELKAQTIAGKDRATDDLTVAPKT